MYNKKFLLIVSLASFFVCSAMEHAQERNPRMCISFILNHEPAPITHPVAEGYFVIISEFCGYTRYKICSSSGDVVKRYFECTICGACFKKRDTCSKHYWNDHT